jgi:hypothetical protein
MAIRKRSNLVKRKSEYLKLRRLDAIRRYASHSGTSRQPVSKNILPFEIPFFA